MILIKIEQADAQHIDCSLIHVMLVQISNPFSTLLSFRQKSFLPEQPVSLSFYSGIVHWSHLFVQSLKIKLESRS